MAEWFPRYTLGSLPSRAAATHGGREALVFEGRRWSFAQVSAEVDLAARGLMALGIQPGERVALWLNNRPEWVFLFLAALRIGAVAVPVNTRWRARELAYLLGQAGCSTLIAEARSGPVDYLAMVRETLPGLAGGDAENLAVEGFPALRRVVLFSAAPVPGTVAAADLEARAAGVPADALEARAAAVSPDDLALLIYTSGTTGFPKGAMHAHALVRNVVDRVNRLAITPADTIVMYLPLFHIFGLTEGLVSSLLSGARMALTPRFDPGQVLEVIEREAGTVIIGFDLHFQELLEACACTGKRPATLRLGFLAAGMRNTTPIARRVQRELCPTVSGYGMSEFGVGAAVSFLTSTEEQRCEASGYPAPGYEIRIADPGSGAPLPPGEEGEIQVRGYAMMLGYFDKPEETARVLDADGWLHSGDLGLFRPDGHLRFLGRIKDMLKVGGENVDPMEVEGLLLEHPAIHQAAVVGFPDERLGEVGVAFVQPSPGGGLTPQAVVDHCKGRIAGFKVPRHAFLVEDFPITASGKIQKAELRKVAAERLASTKPD